MCVRKEELGGAQRGKTQTEREGAGDGDGDGDGDCELCECNLSVSVFPIPDFSRATGIRSLLIALMSVLQCVEHDAGH